MEAKDVAEMTAMAFNSLEERISEDMAELKQGQAELKHGLAELKHSQAELKLQVDVHQRVTEEKLDRGFREILRHLDSG